MGVDCGVVVMERDGHIWEVVWQRSSLGERDMRYRDHASRSSSSEAVEMSL